MSLKKLDSNFLDTFLDPPGRASGAVTTSLVMGAVKRKDSEDVTMMPLGNYCNIPVYEQLMTTVGSFLTSFCCSLKHVMEYQRSTLCYHSGAVKGGKNSCHGCPTWL